MQVINTMIYLRIYVAHSFGLHVKHQLVFRSMNVYSDIICDPA